MPIRIIRWTDVDFAVGLLRTDTAACKAVAGLIQNGERFRSKSISRPRETDRFWHFDAREFVFHQRQFTRQPCGVARNRKIIMRPCVVANFESHSVNRSDLLPRQEPGIIGHPPVGNEEGRLKTEFPQQGRNKVDMALDRIVKRQDHASLHCGPNRYCRCSGKKRAPAEAHRAASEWLESPPLFMSKLYAPPCI